MSKFNEDLLEILACPITKEKLIYDKDKNILISESAKLSFPIRNGIPVILIDEASKIQDDK